MNHPFVDYYEVLQLSQTANADTVERVYRLLAKRYHPDNRETGDVDKFTAVRQAFEVLSDSTLRAEYDVKSDDNRSMMWKIFDQTSAADARESDRRIFHGILSLLYVARRRQPEDGGLGVMHLEKMLGCPAAAPGFPAVVPASARPGRRFCRPVSSRSPSDGIDKLSEQANSSCRPIDSCEALCVSDEVQTSGSVQELRSKTKPEVSTGYRRVTCTPVRPARSCPPRS